jgi:hypothetical protein
MKKILALLLSGVIAVWCAAPAWADEDEEEESSSNATEENFNFYYGRGNNPFLAPAGDEPQEEIFYFGESAQEDFVQEKFSRFQDITGKASRDIKKIIGLSLITTSVTMTVWGIFFHTEQNRPDNWQKIYEGTGVVLLNKEHTVNVPTVVAGICLSGGGIWLMQRD